MGGLRNLGKCKRQATHDSGLRSGDPRTVCRMAPGRTFAPTLARHTPALRRGSRRSSQGWSFNPSIHLR